MIAEVPAKRFSRIKCIWYFTWCTWRWD